jgi:hypothetical protein
MIDGRRYDCVTRIVITPHFSYNENFRPQFRMSTADWLAFSHAHADCVEALTASNGFQVVPVDPVHPMYYICIRLSADPVEAAKAKAFLESQFPDAYAALTPYFFDPHAMMAGVLDQMLANGTLVWQDQAGATGFLGRTAGSCQFCVNKRWQLPLGCPYEKNKEVPPPVGFLEKVARFVVEEGRVVSQSAVTSQMQPPDPAAIDKPAVPRPLDQSEATARSGSTQVEIPPTKDSK